MLITKIVQNKKNKNRYSIFLDGQFSFAVSDENLLKLRLKEGMEIDDDKMRSIQEDEESKKALDSVWRLLGVRSRSQKELTDKLKTKKLSTANIEKAIQKVKDLGYINDEKFARERVGYLRQKAKGTSLIKMELRKAGISGDIIRDALSEREFSKEAEIEQIKNLAVTRLKRMGKVDPKTASNRLMGFLVRRGFDMDAIREGLKKAKLEISENEY